MKTVIRSLTFALTIFIFYQAAAQLPPVFQNYPTTKIRASELTTKYLTPERIVWVSDNSGNQIQNIESILNPGTGQADLNKGKYLNLISSEKSCPGIILDFGREIHGGLEVITTISNQKPVGRIRIRFGESVSETMSDIGAEGGATNDHAMRDFIVSLPWLGRLEVGNSGFRFVRIDLVDPDTKIEIKEINAVFVFRDLPYTGSFQCNDELLNQIWMTGAYTVHLNMQDYLWDGIKRDRLVWIGDMYPEVMTINSVFGYNKVVPKSLDLARDITPLPGWMNGISSYSMWWVLIHRNWYYYQGDLEYLKQQKDYLVSLLNLLATKIDPSGKETLDGRFLDHPSTENPDAVHAGLQSLMIMTFQAGYDLCKVLDDQKTSEICRISIEKLKKHIPGMAGSKQAAALLALSGLITPEKANSEMLARDGVHKMSTFYGYYMLNARALAGDFQGALDNIREYWGGMIKLGATTFWEDFDIDWMRNAARIDEIAPEGKIDVHGTYGKYCYIGYRHSYCHGWASGPTSWLTQYVLGVNVIEPGCKKLKIEPHLGDLKWVKGSFPTPFGKLEIEHRRMPDGTVKTSFKAPKEVSVTLK
ncbi:MAG: alpha-L-rhamnosidase [Bacteroidales bacterium]|nr:alpha-L-rhamnosidase [Bacteroidales bacterium]